MMKSEAKFKVENSLTTFPPTTTKYLVFIALSPVGRDRITHIVI